MVAFLPPLRGLFWILHSSHGLRRGLHSFAASRLVLAIIPLLAARHSYDRPGRTHSSLYFCDADARATAEVCAVSANPAANLTSIATVHR